jgi:hypothetical protein
VSHYLPNDSKAACRKYFLPPGPSLPPCNASSSVARLSHLETHTVSTALSPALAKHWVILMVMGAAVVTLLHK